MARVKIYQLAYEGEKAAAWAHGGYAHAMKNGFDPSCYDMVHAFEDPYGNLAAIYAEFNGNQPKGYRGRPLSVSDVVVVNEVAYYLDNQGFVEVSKRQWHDCRIGYARAELQLVAA